MLILQLTLRKIFSQHSHQSSHMTPDTIASAFLAASRAELTALKPGNVHIFADGHRMSVADFEASAVACAPFLAKSGARVGERIAGAVTASVGAANTNTNLGIVLLCAPLACAAERRRGTLQARLSAVLTDLNQRDASDAFKAIALANPAGIGRVTRGDVAAPAEITLMEAMALAAPRDRIARAYTTSYQDIFAFGLPVLEAAMAEAETEAFAITTLHMRLMAEFADTHITRKYGEASARDVREEARAMRATMGQFAGQASFAALLAFDASLKSRGLNPGTTADFVVATVFARHLTQPKA
jgi:triphosphoribosyl-dephospho-CoA synthase